MKVIGGIAVFFGVIVLILGLTWLSTGNDFFLYKYWAPKQANVQREVFINTNSYIQGKDSQLTTLCFQYQTADAGHKPALATYIRGEASSVDMTKLSPNVQTCVNSIGSF